MISLVTGKNSFDRSGYDRGHFNLALIHKFTIIYIMRN
jgi:hypothetical protein